ncbi:MAG: glycine zipper family protein [Pseudomonas sp.]|nr:glycine zipper family protein [Pseudomonas sp.]
MKSRIWRLAGVGLLCLGVSAQTLAEGPNSQQEQQRGEQHGPQGGQHNGEHGGGQQNRAPQQDNRTPSANRAPPQENRAPQQNRVQPNQFPQNQYRQPQPQQNQFPQNQYHQPEHVNQPPIQPRPDTVRQTQEPIRGNYQDLRPQNGGHNNWQAGGRPDDHRWPGRPDGHGNGWGGGPRYRPGQMIERFPGQEYRVPYRGQDFFYSGGYWYRPLGTRYEVVTPPYGIRTRYIPDYAQEMWIGGALFFVAAGSYYQWQDDSQDYVVVNPPQQPVQVQQQEQQASPYDVASYPAYGQSPEQVQQDRYDCYRWAVEQTHFDPASATYAPDPSVVASFRNATASCLSGRGYQVN